jgi:hypothetical protein
LADDGKIFERNFLSVATMTKAHTTQPRHGSQQRKKLHMVTTGYDAAEFAELDEAASRAGLTRASFQRVQSLTAPKTRSTRRAPIERELLAKVLGQLGKVGSNLNQIAHAAHLDRASRAEIGATVAEIRAMLPVILKALGRKL